MDLCAADAAALTGLAGEPLVDLRYRFDGREVMIRATGIEPFVVYETAAARQLAASSSLPNLVALIADRLLLLRQLGIVPDLAGSLVPLLTPAGPGDQV